MVSFFVRPRGAGRVWERRVRVPLAACVLLSACADAAETRQVVTNGLLAAGAELREVQAPAQPVEFSGRVPRLGRGSTETLSMRRVFGDSVSFARISSIRVIGDRLLVTDRQMSQHVAVIDRASGQVLRRFGAHGPGPGEFLDPSWSIPVDGASPRAWMYDFQNRRLTLLDLENPGRPSQWQTRSLELGVSVMQVHRSGDRLVSNGLFPDYTLLVTDTAGRPLHRIVAEPPFTKRDLDHLDGRRALNRNYMAVDPSGERFMLAYQFRSRLDFFNAAGERYGTVRGPRDTRPSFGVDGSRFHWNQDNEMAFSGATGTERYVYTLFCGCKLGDDRPAGRVQVFRWNGDFVAEIALDRPVLGLAVSPDDGTLYAAVEEPYPGVGEWKLPAWLAQGRTPEAR